MKSVLVRLKPFPRWLMGGAVLFFLLQVLRKHWQGIVAIRIDAAGWAALAIALGITLLAHICAGWVWSGILRRDLQQPVSGSQLVQAYLQTNIAKYVPGNIWHYYGRVRAAQNAGATLETATVSVLLEPLLMAASALIVALVSGQAISSQYGWSSLIVLWLGLLATLLAIHPQVLNRVLQRLAKAKQRTIPATAQTIPAQLNRYPVRALFGNLVFVGLRGVGFLFAFMAIQSLTLAQIPILLSGFSLAWLLGLVVPGAPGGLGIFEATAIALLEPLYLPSHLLAVVACYRLVSTIAETLGAGISWIEQRLAMQRIG
jgi:hypothetical protein